LYGGLVSEARNENRAERIVKRLRYAFALREKHGEGTLKNHAAYSAVRHEDADADALKGTPFLV
jgi:hypothetical protein